MKAKFLLLSILAGFLFTSCIKTDQLSDSQQLGKGQIIKIWKDKTNAMMEKGNYCSNITLDINGIKQSYRLQEPFDFANYSELTQMNDCKLLPDTGSFYVTKYEYSGKNYALLSSTQLNKEQIKGITENDSRWNMIYLVLFWIVIIVCILKFGD